MNQGRIKAVGAFIAAFAFITFGSAGVADAAVTKPVKAKGVAAVIDGDEPMARDAAIKDALRKAVEQHVGTMIESETVTENFELLSDKIFSRSAGFVETYSVGSSGVKAGVYEVEINAKVKSGDVRDSLDGTLLILRNKNVPRILIMVAEQNVGDPRIKAWWSKEEKVAATAAGGNITSSSMDVVENEFINYWSAKGFKFVDRNVLLGKIKVGPSVGTLDSNTEAVKEFGKLAGADVVVVGKAIVTEQDQGMMGTRMRNYQASASLRVINTDDASILATATLNGVGGHINKTEAGTRALKNVAQRAGAILATKILEKWRAEGQSGGTLTITFNGLQKFKHVRVVEKFLKNKIRGVTAVRKRGYKNKVAVFEMDMTGSAGDLAVLVEDKKWPGFKVEVAETTANTVTINVVK